MHAWSSFSHRTASTTSTRTTRTAWDSATRSRSQTRRLEAFVCLRQDCLACSTVVHANNRTHPDGRWIRHDWRGCGELLTGASTDAHVTLAIRSDLTVLSRIASA